MEELRIEYLPVESLKPYERNAKLHPAEQVAQIKRSIEDNGMNDPIGIWGKDNTIVEGHGRWLACKELGMQTVPVIRLDHMTDAQRKEYALIHNQTTMNSGLDLDILNMELADLPDFDADFYGFELQEPDNVKEDDYNPEIPEEPKAKRGEIYRLGRHRLMCGDSTSAEDVRALVNGDPIDMLLTDPPYNLNVGNCFSINEARKRHMRQDGLVIANDHMESNDFFQFLRSAFVNARSTMRAGAAFHVWHAESESVNFRNAIKESGMTVRQMLIWVKSSPVFGRQDFHRQYEPVLVGDIELEDEDDQRGYESCLYGWKDGAKHSWYKKRKEKDVLYFDKPVASKEHPTMKPILLFDYEMKCNTKPGDKVLDLFGGSGTTIMAAEQNGRDAYVMEFDPRFVDVIIDRWEKFTGEKAVLING